MAFLMYFSEATPVQAVGSWQCLGLSHIHATISCFYWFAREQILKTRIWTHPGYRKPIKLFLKNLIITRIQKFMGTQSVSSSKCYNTKVKPTHR